MSYSYEEMRPEVFTDNGQKMFLKIRDRAHKLLNESGTCQLGSMISGCTGDSWTMIACVDRMVELGEIKEIPNPFSGAGQHRIFVKRA